MKPLLTREAVRAIDLDAVNRLGIPSLVLMENAGIRAAEVVVEKFSGRLGQAAIIAGPGQNGGDGWVVARQLYNRGVCPRLVLIGSEESVKGDARVNLQALRNLGLQVTVASDSLEGLDRALNGASLSIDALFGTGLDRPVQGIYAEAISRMNRCDAPCVALDLPSGVDADTGQELGKAVRARLTVTFAARKRGLYHHPGAELAGEVVLASIGVPEPIDALAQLLEPADVAEWVARRPPGSHKATAGDVLIVAGSPGRTGAAMLSGLGALRSGAGLVTVAARGNAREALDAKVVELMTAQIPLDPAEARSVALNLAAQRSSAVVGPGLGLDAAGKGLARSLALELPVPAVLDADALTSIGTDLEMLKNAAAPRVLTPHPGEAARLLGVDSAGIQADRYQAAARIAERSGCVAVLKGACSIVAEPGGKLRVCDRGTPALGVAGTGDVLSGVIGSLLAALPPFDAATAGVFLHALAGELKAQSDRGLLAREVADALPSALEKCRGSSKQS